MIKVRILKEKEKVKKITLTGHALYDDYGRDIVCASVSATVLCTINGLLTIDEKSIDVESKKDKLEININSTDLVTTKLIDNMLNCLSSVENDYPKNLEIK